MNTTEFYRTSSLDIAALIAMSLPVHAIDRTDQKRASFLFERTDDLDDFVAAYYRRELTVEPQAYFAAIKAVKARLYENG